MFRGHLLAIIQQQWAAVVEPLAQARTQALEPSKASDIQTTLQGGSFCGWESEAAPSELMAEARLKPETSGFIAQAHSHCISSATCLDGCGKRRGKLESACT